MYTPQYKACPQCRTPAEMHASHCSRCGQMFHGQPGPSSYGAPVYAQSASQGQAAQKVPAGICGILLGGFGIHKFLLGYTAEGLITLMISLFGGLLTFGIAPAVMHIIGIVEGVIYLTKTDAEFVDTYVVRKKGWF